MRVKMLVVGIGVALASMFADTNATVEASPSPHRNECQTWAYNEGEDGYPDSIILHTIGCDDGGATTGVYVRMEGRCASVARNAYRNGYAAASQALDDYMMTKGCDTFEDGTYGRV